MNYGILNRLIGYDRYRIRVPRAETAVNVLLNLNIPFWDLRVNGEGELLFCASLLLRKRLCALCAQQSWEYTAELCGLPRRLWLYRKRWGIFLGVSFFLWFLQFASSHVWDVRVVGREADEDLKQSFYAAGLQEGMKVSQFDNARFSAAFLAENEEYSYVSAGIHGGIALVWLHPREPAPLVEQNTGAANLVAAEEGEILRCEASYGQVMVTFGDRVQKGQLLVSGVVETKNGGCRLERASGRVLAKVKKEYSVRIPRTCQRKVYTGEEKTATGIRILGKNINFFGFYGKNLKFCDTIDSVEEFTPIGGIQLPLERVKRTFAPYRMETVTYSVAEATRLAYDAYYCFLNDQLGAMEVLEEAFQVEADSDGVTLHAVLTVVMDIAQRRDITVGELVLPSPEKG